MLLAWCHFGAQHADPARWQAALDASLKSVAAQHLLEDHGPGWRVAWIGAGAHPRGGLKRDARGTCLALDGSLSHPSGTPWDSTAPAQSTGPAQLMGCAGDWAGLWVDPAAAQLSLFRDPLGQRRLVYLRHDQELWVASRESVLLAAFPALAGAWDEEYLAAYFAAAAPPAGSTMYRAIREVDSGQWIRWQDGRLAVHTHPLQPEPWQTCADATAVELLRARLGEAIAACDGPALGISLSAGLDSQALASLHPEPARVRAYTYGFDHHPDIDERAAVRAEAARRGYAHVGLAVDALDPLSAAGERPLNLDTPLANPYREFKSLLYRQAAADGVSTLWNGHFGDHLQPAHGEWLRAAWREGRRDLIAQQWQGCWRRDGWRGCWREPGWRAQLKSWLGLQPAPRALPGLRAEWLHAIEARRRETLDRYREWPNPALAATALGRYAAFDAGGERVYAEAHGLDLRYPYRHLPLVRSVLGMPAHLWWRDGQAKWALRECLRPHLAPALRLRAKGSDLAPVFVQAWKVRHPAVFERLIEGGRPWWRRYFDEERVRAALSQPMPEGPAQLLAWQLAAFGLFCQAHDKLDLRLPAQ